MSHASKRSKDEQREEITAAVADGVARGLREGIPELDRLLAATAEKIAAELARAVTVSLASAVSAASRSARGSTR